MASGTPQRTPRMRRPRRHDEHRTDAQLAEHYLVERELADRLRQAPRERRRDLYAQVYDELLQRVAHHPYLRRRTDPRGPEDRRRRVALALGFLHRFLSPAAAFMEIGAGDCALSLYAAAHVRRVYAVEVSAQIASDVAHPANFELVLIDGTSLPLADGAVDVAFSDQVMEHLHPDDAQAQLCEIFRSLAPGGVYVCITPNRLYGPRDISEYFDKVATGLHLREYTATELRRILLDAGFARVSFYAGARGRFVRVPYAMIRLLESSLDLLPYRLKKLLADNAPMRALLGVRIAAFKPSSA